MTNIWRIRRKILSAITMLEAARNVKGNRITRLMRMDGGIALADGYLDEAKKLLRHEMDLIEKLNSEQNPERSVATEDAQSDEAGKQKYI